MAIKYKVKWGDTLWDLSRKYGVTIDSIVKANKQIKDPHWIYTGDTPDYPHRGLFRRQLFQQQKEQQLLFVQQTGLL